jgi:murein DD-endopeptidase
MKPVSAIIALPLASILLPIASSHRPEQVQTSDVPISIEAPITPTPVRGDGKIHLAYELYVTNLGASALTLVRLDVFSNENKTSLLASYQGSKLIDCMIDPKATDELPDKQVIRGGRRAMIYLWVTVDKVTAFPGRLRHRLLFKSIGVAGKNDQSLIKETWVNITNEAALVIGPPLRGSWWVAFEGPSNNSHHRRALIPIGDKWRIPCRFATDWGKADENGKLLHGDASENSSYYGYGAEVIAVADASVTGIRDRLPENTPLSDKPAVPFTLLSAPGNYVILDLGKKRYALYAHLQPGSLRVKVGDRVLRGQVLGLVGNSGNSTGPHLHFQISDLNTPLLGEGLPYVIDEFEVVSNVKSRKKPTGAGHPSEGVKAVVEKRQMEIPLNETIVRFP